MTLIVAKIIDDKIYIESDSKITDQDAVINDPLTGILKTIIVIPFLSISFTGNIYFAEEAIREIILQTSFNLNKIIIKLFEAHVKSEYKTDFIIASIFNKRPQLFKISNNKIEDNQNSLWIGDNKGFELFQSKFLPALSNGLDEVDSFSLAFKEVINNESITTVGNFNITMITCNEICPTHPVFRYQSKISIIATENQEIKMEGSNEWQPVSLGSAAKGSFGITYLTSVAPHLHGVAIHFTHGDFGVVFCPQISFEGIIVRNVKGEEFANTVKRKYELPLAGIIRDDEFVFKYIDTRS